ncbi:HD domain-containing protein [Tepidibacter formicigenes]|uniref:HDIG domain-containing protein n=1 Tax=Tepidibacter formicigenes DSM 15518 TaxID=1123349 RepID=A0A1M6PNW2_9FIRM|nr:HD domain-containing protein [Tepidibacter formicigenes]SHK09633.1 HDIG domain-containing protein [Tepidibacter formicigenes DSM 15518]
MTEIFDLNNKTIKHTSDDIFKKEPINMIKAVTLMSQLEFDIDEETQKLIRENSSLLKSVSPEKMRDEIFKILKSNKSYYYINLMDKHLNILDKIFPEIIPMKSVGECKYHVVDALTHSIYTLKIAESVINLDGFFENHIKKEYEKHCLEKIEKNRTRLDLIKLGALFHDVGKPRSKKVDETGRVRFKGHEIVGAQIIKDIANRFKLTDKEKYILYKYVALHMWPLVVYKKNDVSGKMLNKMFLDTKDETLDILLIGYSDIVATRKLLNPHEDMGMFKVHIEYIANNYITRYKGVVSR